VMGGACYPDVDGAYVQYLWRVWVERALIVQGWWRLDDRPAGREVDLTPTRQHRCLIAE
jgi:hypothetical protein